MALVEIGKKWPPEADRARLQRYEEFRKFFRGLHQDAFRYLGAVCETDSSLRRKIYIILNYAGLMSRKCADLLVGEPPTFLVTPKRAKRKDKSETPAVLEEMLLHQETLQEVLDDLVEDNLLASTLHQGEMTASSRGDLVLRVRDDGSKVVLETVQPHSYFARFNPDNQSEVTAEAIAWTRKIGQQWYLRVEHHQAGSITQEAYRCQAPGDDGCLTVMDQVALADAYELGEDVPPDFQVTGMDESLIEHVPNFCEGGDFWGISDYDDLAPIFEALNNRLSKIDAYLDKHAGPKLIGVKGMAGPDGNVEGDKLEFFEADDPQLAAAIRYVTWEGQMIPSFSELDNLLEHLCRLSEMPREMFGLKNAASIDSEPALRTSLTGTVSKINRKRQLIDPKLKKSILKALRLSHLRYGTPDPAAYKLDIAWQDGIPDSYSSIVHTEAERVGAKLGSRQKAIERIDRCSPQQAQEELSRIDSEQSTGADPLRETPGIAGESGSNAGGNSGSGAPGPGAIPVPSAGDQIPVQ